MEFSKSVILKNINTFNRYFRIHKNRLFNNKKCSVGYSTIFMIDFDKQIDIITKIDRMFTAYETELCRIHGLCHVTSKSTTVVKCNDEGWGTFPCDEYHETSLTLPFALLHEHDDEYIDKVACSLVTEIYKSRLIESIKNRIKLRDECEAEIIKVQAEYDNLSK